MKITITMDLTAENLNKLRALLPDAQIPGQLSMFDSPSEAPVEPKPAAESKEVPATEEKKITKTDIRAVAAKLSNLFGFTTSISMTAALELTLLLQLRQSRLTALSKADCSKKQKSLLGLKIPKARRSLKAGLKIPQVLRSIA